MSATNTIWAIDPICGLPITHADRAETLRLLQCERAKNAIGFLLMEAELATIDEDDDELRFVKAEVAS